MLKLKKHLRDNVKIVTFAVGKTVKLEDRNRKTHNSLKINYLAFINNTGDFNIKCNIKVIEIIC